MWALWFVCTREVGCTTRMLTQRRPFSPLLSSRLPFLSQLTAEREDRKRREAEAEAQRLERRLMRRAAGMDSSSSDESDGEDGDEGTHAASYGREHGGNGNGGRPASRSSGRPWSGASGASGASSSSRQGKNTRLRELRRVASDIMTESRHRNAHLDARDPHLEDYVKPGGHGVVFRAGFGVGLCGIPVHRTPRVGVTEK